MRNSGFPAAALAVALIGVAGAALRAPDAPTPRVAAVAAIPPLDLNAPLALGAAAGPDLVPEPQAPAVTPSAEAPSAEMPAAEAPPAASDDLPTVAVDQRPVHAVPDSDSTPIPHVTLHDRDGAVMTPGRAAERTAAVAPAMHSGAGAASHFAGNAHPGAGITVDVAGRAVPLFGVRLPPASDRCDGTAPDCAAAAHAVLAQRLGAGGAVTCHVPPGQTRRAPSAICLDSTGTDLAGFLVAQGLALADPTQSYEYVSAEGAARAQKRGLWRHR